MESDTEQLINSYNWNKEIKRIKDEQKEILEIICKINENENDNTNNLDKKEHTQELKNKIKHVKELLDKYEMELNNSEIKGDSSEIIKKREDQFILLSKEYERIENIASVDAIGNSNSIDVLLNSKDKNQFVKDISINIPQNEDDAELLQLQEILLDEQDKNLDILEDVIERHKEIGEAINNEIDAHITLMESLEDELEDTQERTDRTRRRIDQIGKFHELSNY